MPTVHWTGFETVFCQEEKKWIKEWSSLCYESVSLTDIRHDSLTWVKLIHLSWDGLIRKTNRTTYFASLHFFSCLFACISSFPVLACFQCLTFRFWICCILPFFIKNKRKRKKRERLPFNLPILCWPPFLSNSIYCFQVTSVLLTACRNCCI